jgi:hypothetical protein
MKYVGRIPFKGMKGAKCIAKGLRTLKNTFDYVASDFDSNLMSVISLYA